MSGPNHRVRLLLTGAGGFIGRRVLRAAETSSGTKLRLVSHRQPVAAHGHEVVTADLSRPESLRGICRDIDVVLHCAALIGGDEEQSHRVNALGTRELVAEAQRAGVRRIVHLSTAAVCGPGPFGPGPPPVAPASATSRSRAAAEQYVLAAGGTVVRPDLVYGTGDRHVVPGLVHLHRAAGARVDGWSAALSMIDADDLARFLLALVSATGDVSGVRYVNHPSPVRCSVVMDTLARSFGLPPHTADITGAAARAVLLDDRRALHHLGFLAHDRPFADPAPWQELSLAPGTPFQDSLDRHLPWYRTLLPPPGPDSSIG